MTDAHDEVCHTRRPLPDTPTRIYRCACVANGANLRPRGWRRVPPYRARINVTTRLICIRKIVGLETRVPQTTVRKVPFECQCQRLVAWQSEVRRHAFQLGTRILPISLSLLTSTHRAPFVGRMENWYGAAKAETTSRTGIRPASPPTAPRSSDSEWPAHRRRIRRDCRARASEKATIARCTNPSSRKSCSYT